MRPTSTIRIPQPCHESWDAMTPTGPGRHCAACQKVVVDFTQKTDAEILAYLAHTAGQSCGRFRAEQLERPLQPAAAASRWRSWLASVLALSGVLGGGRAAAQTEGRYYGGGPTPLTNRPTTGSAAAAGPAATKPQAAETPATQPSGASGPLVVRGTVTDAATGNRLPGVTVVLQGTARGVSTDANGEFELTLTEQDVAGTLLVSFVGYTLQRLPVATGGPPLAVKLVEDAFVLGGEVIVVGGYSARRPYPWHPRAFFNWSKHWLTRPFRR